jgi:hypothetical protein
MARNPLKFCAALCKGFCRESHTIYEEGMFGRDFRQRICVNLKNVVCVRKGRCLLELELKCMHVDVLPKAHACRCLVKTVKQDVYVSVLWL